jgi:Tol biopolymer transport system component
MQYTKFVSRFLLFLLALAGGFQTARGQLRMPVLASSNPSGDSSGNAASYLNSAVPRASLSANGRWLVFISEASDLVSNARDSNFAPDVYVRDLHSGVTQLVSVNLDGTGSGNNTSSNPMISADGRFVAFESAASDLVANDDNTNLDVFLRDLQTGVTTLVTTNTNGAASRNDTLFLTLFGLSRDGRVVLFSSGARDLVTNDQNDSADLYVRDTVANKTTLVTVNLAGQASGSRSRLTSSGFFNFNAVLSADGRAVAFTSYINDLVTNDLVCLERCDGANGLSDVFVRDLVENKTEFISVNSKGSNGGNALSLIPAISADGQVVAFRSFATDLVGNDRTPQADIYVRHRRAQTTTLASVNLAGTNGGTDGRENGLNTSNHLLSGNGRFVAFSAVAVDIAPNKTNLLTTDIFVRDLETGLTTLASVNLKGVDTPSDASNQYLSIAADFSDEGRYLVFRSTAPDLAENDFNQADDLFVRDLVAAKTRLISLNREARGSGNGRSLTADSSANGHVFALDSEASDIAAVDGNHAPDVFIWINSSSAPPQINTARQSPEGRLIISGENFDQAIKVFVDRREINLSQRSGSLLISKTVLLRDGRYEVRVVNEDGQAHSTTLLVRSDGTANLHEDQQRLRP